jgi:DNA invertase Pin-like site-specific DNA recombinase
MQSCVIYCRESPVSTVATDVKFDNQEQDCRDYAQKQGYSIYKVYRESHSGADLLHRPLIWEAIDDIKDGNAQVLLVRNFDRLARKTEHAGVIKYEVREKYHGRVESALESNEETLTDKLLDVIAEAEREHSMVRMLNGRRKRGERGELIGSSNPTYGYRWADDEPNKRTVLEIEPETAEVVTRIFGLVLAGRSLRDIARLFNAEGVLTPSQWNEAQGHIGRRKVGEDWEREMLRRIIRDETYTGKKRLYQRHWVQKDNGKWRAIMRPTSDHILVSVPVLIEKDTFNAAHQALLDKDKNGRPPIDQEAAWLRGHVFCGVCGSRMGIVRCKTPGSYEYRCWRRPNSATNEDKACPGGNFQIVAHHLDQRVYEHLAYMMMRREEIAELMLNQLGRDKIRALVSMAEGYEAQLKEKREQRDAARRMSWMTKDEAQAQEYMDDARELRDQVHKLEREYAEARDELDSFNAENEWVNSTLKRIYDHNPIREIVTAEIVKGFPYEEKRVLLAATAVRVEVFPKNWAGRETRFDVYSDWEVAAGGGRGIVSQPRYQSFHLIIRLDRQSLIDTIA